MKTLTIALDTIEKVRSFVNIVSRHDGEFDLVSGRHIIDAKSIMGIFSLDLSKPLSLQVHSPDEYDSVSEELKDFLS